MVFPNIIRRFDWETGKVEMTRCPWEYNVSKGGQKGIRREKRSWGEKYRHEKHIEKNWCGHAKCVRTRSQLRKMIDQIGTDPIHTCVERNLDTGEEVGKWRNQWRDMVLLCSRNIYWFFKGKKKRVGSGLSSFGASPWITCENKLGFQPKSNVSLSRG